MRGRLRLLRRPPRTGKEMVDRHYGNADCRATRFHEELLEAATSTPC